MHDGRADTFTSTLHRRRYAITRKSTPINHDETPEPHVAISMKEGESDDKG